MGVDRSEEHNGGVSHGRTRVDVLGPLRAQGPAGEDLTPAGPLQRRLLALLVLRRGLVVSSGTAVEALWPGDLPRDPAGALQNHVSRLRAALPPDAIASVGDGYRLDPTAIDLDAERVVALVAESDRWDDAATADARAILDRWHGPAYPELDDVDDARIEAARLDELRIRLHEELAAHRLAAGRTEGLAAELASLVETEPLRERPRALLMEALAADGRPADALRAYDDFRRLLGDELGIDPSPALAARHAELLAGSAAVPPRRLHAAPLPAPTTSLFGRDDLVQEVVGLVDDGRLVSLVGPGGVGKTRLLVEVGRRLADADPSRAVVLCELATADEDSATNVVAAALGIDVRPGVALAVQVAGVVGADDVVLLADNCEHVLGRVAVLVDDLLARCPNLRVVATSRERLRVGGEHVVTVPTLPVEAGSPAVELFLARARAVDHRLAPDAEDLACIEEIVRRLDGLPLAIELAAACLHTHDVRDVAAGLDRRFSLLTTGARTSPRHESLAAAVEWSFGLLDPTQQQVFVALSAFVGSFDVAGAAAVCGLDEGPTTEALVQLAERSLVVRLPGRRFTLLETLREFGARHLATTGRLDEIRDRHARHAVDWVEEADRRLARPGRVVDDVDAALPELHSALGWLLDRDELHLAGRLVASLLDYGIIRLRPDVLMWSERVASADPDDAAPLAAMMSVVGAYGAWMAGDLPGCGARCARALAAAERSGDPLGSEVLTVNGSYALFEGRLDDAAAWYRRAVEAAEDDPQQLSFARSTELLALGYAGDPSADARAEALLADTGDDDTPYTAYAWYCAGEADLARGDVDRARRRLEQAIAVAGRSGSSFVTGIAGASKASIDARLGDPALAARDYRELIAHWRRAGMWSTQWTMLRSIAGLVARQGRPRDAAVLVGAIRATAAGHSIFGADEVALAELAQHLREVLGEDDLEAALAEGAVLDGEATVEHALRVL